MALLEELKALVEKYGYDPKNGGLDKDMNEAADARAIVPDESVFYMNEDDSVCPRDSEYHGMHCASNHVGCDDTLGVNADGNCTNCGTIENK